MTVNDAKNTCKGCGPRKSVAYDANLLLFSKKKKKLLLIEYGKK